MKTPFLKLVLGMVLLILSVQYAKAACTASFTKSISGNTVTFTNTSTTTSGFPNMMISYWNFGDGTTSYQKNPVKTYNSAGPKIVQLTINDSFGCVTTVIDTIMVGSASPTCNASFTKSISGLTATFTNTSTSSAGMGNVHFLWYFSGGGYSTLATPPPQTYPIAGYYFVQLTMYDSTTHCSSTFSDSILVTSPTNSCNANFSMAISGRKVTLYNMSTNTNGLSTGLFYYWQFADGTSSTLKDPVKTFASNGSKAIKLTISDSSQGCFDSLTDTAVIVSQCSADFSIIKSGLTISLTNNSLNADGTTSGLSYNWNFGDMTSSNAKNPFKTYTTPGLKNIMLAISDSIQGCYAVKHDTFTLTTSTCQAGFTKSVNSLTVTLTNTSTNGNTIGAGLTYNWQFSDGTSSPFPNPVKTFASAGTKTISLTIFDTITGCFSNFTDSVVLTSSSACAANFTKTVSGLTVSLTNTSLNTNGSSAGLSYLWNFSDGTTSTQKNPVKTFATGGYKTINLFISDTLLGCFSSKTDTILLSSASACQASFTFPLIAPLTVKVTSTSTNTNGTTAGLNYNWQFSDGTSATGAFYIKTFATPGVKWALLTISDSLTGCYSTHVDSFMLTGSYCAAGFTKSVSGFTVSLTNTSLNTNGTAAGLAYYWYFSDGTSSTLQNPVKTFTTPGPKTINLTISDTTQGCFSTFTDTVLIIPPVPLCQASFSLAIDTSAPFHFFILNTSIIQLTSTFYWDFGDGSSSTSMTPSHTYANFGYYNLCLTVSDSLCTSTYCDTIGMDSNGVLLKQGAFGFQTLDYTKLATTGIKETAAAPEYLIYPNPGNAEVFIDYTLMEQTPLTIRVTDITGKEMMVQHIERQSGKHIERLDISELRPAVYFISIQSSEAQKNYKLIKN